MAQPRRRGGREHGQKASGGDAARPVAEHSGREAVVRHDQPRGLGRIVELARADRRERQIPECPATLPALVTGLGGDAFGLGGRIEARQRLEPVDPGQTVPTLAAPLGVEKVVGKRVGVLCGEAQRTDPLLDLHGGEDTYGMVPEAKLENGVPQGEGWFVVNARDSRWLYNELGAYCPFEGKDDARFEQLGINLNVLPPGMPMAMYHEEPGQEGFLVLRGECLLVVEGEERPLRTWDFVHCPPRTKHVILGAGESPALVLAVGARKGGASYPVDETAVRLGAGVSEEVASPKEAYAKFSPLEEGPAPEL
jgi:mannose-6-phosphate isomerase-like protein (cupin superfamily)